MESKKYNNWPKVTREAKIRVKLRGTQAFWLQGHHFLHTFCFLSFFAFSATQKYLLCMSLAFKRIKRISNLTMLRFFQKQKQGTLVHALISRHSILLVINCDHTCIFCLNKDSALWRVYLSSRVVHDMIYEGSIIG